MNFRILRNENTKMMNNSTEKNRKIKQIQTDTFFNRTISINAPAKINLFLDTDGISNNGYHAIKSVMQTVDLFDTINIMHIYGDPRIEVICGNIASSDNVAYIAAVKFFEHTETVIQNKLIIEINKKIPVAAGLGGGSADARGPLTGAVRDSYAATTIVLTVAISSSATSTTTM